MSVHDPMGTVRRITEAGPYHRRILIRTAATDYPWIDITTTWIPDNPEEDEQFEAFTHEGLPESEIIGVVPGMEEAGDDGTVAGDEAVDDGVGA